MGEFKWNPLKNERLKKLRGVSFEELTGSKLIKIQKHPKKEHQDVMLFDYKGYVWIVPYVDNGSEIFLKTLYPSRKYTKLYRRGEI